jgi:hypothetical protein
MSIAIEAIMAGARSFASDFATRCERECDRMGHFQEIAAGTPALNGVRIGHSARFGSSQVLRQHGDWETLSVHEWGLTSEICPP